MENKILSLFGNNINHTLNTKLKSEILYNFPQLNNDNSNLGLSLQKYINSSPEKYYNKDLFNKYLNFLDKECNRNDLNEKMTEIEIAIKTIYEINSYNFHEDKRTINEYQSALYINEKILPYYLRLLENIYHVFIYLIAIDSRRKRNKGTDNLDIYNCNDELKFTEFENIGGCYNNTIRNGIAHGKIIFTKDEIEFYDKKGNREILSNSKFISLFDDLVDVCNAFTIALKIYLLNNIDLKISKHLIFEEIKSELDSPWWKIDGILESKIIGNKPQLIVFTQSRTTDKLKLQFYAFLTALYSEFYLNDYEVYFISIRSKYFKGPGWARLDGNILRESRKAKNKSMDNYKSVFLDGGVFALLKYKLPRILYKINGLYHSFKLHMPEAFNEIRMQLQHIKIIIKDTEIHRNGIYLVMNSFIIIPSLEIDSDCIFKNKRRIIKKCLKYSKSIEINKLINILTLGYCRINIFSKDMRVRKVVNYGLGESLIGTLEKKKIKRIKVPNIYSGIEFNDGKYKVVMNQNYLEKDI